MKKLHINDFFCLVSRQEGSIEPQLRLSFTLENVDTSYFLFSEGGRSLSNKTNDNLDLLAPVMPSQVVAEL